jgi:hypothetical protein
MKFVLNVEQKTFGGRYAAQVKQEVLYITERAGNRLGKAGPGAHGFQAHHPQAPEAHGRKNNQASPHGHQSQPSEHSHEGPFCLPRQDNIFFINLENYYMKTSE